MKDRMNGLPLTEQLRAVQLLRLTQAVHTISCILLTHEQPVKYTCLTDVKFMR